MFPSPIRSSQPRSWIRPRIPSRRRMLILLPAFLLLLPITILSLKTAHALTRPDLGYPEWTLEILKATTPTRWWWTPDFAYELFPTSGKGIKSVRRLPRGLGWMGRWVDDGRPRDAWGGGNGGDGGHHPAGDDERETAMGAEADGWGEEVPMLDWLRAGRWAGGWDMPVLKLNTAPRGDDDGGPKPRRRPRPRARSAEAHPIEKEKAVPATEQALGRWDRLRSGSGSGRWKRYVEGLVELTTTSDLEEGREGDTEGEAGGGSRGAAGLPSFSYAGTGEGAQGDPDLTPHQSTSNNGPLTDKDEDEDEDEGALLLHLYIFTTSSRAARARRHLIRSQRWLDAVPERYRHWVAITFVMGRPPSSGSEGGSESEGKGESESEGAGGADDEARAIAEEQETYGDVLILDIEENMNQGKTAEWMRTVGRRTMDSGRFENGERAKRRRAREALWVFKVYDDTLVVVQNLLDVLIHLDPTIPTYIGNPANHWTMRLGYMQGGLYGFSYGIVRTLGDVGDDIPEWELRFDGPEDARVGHFMASLPVRPPDFSARSYPDSSPFPIPFEPSSVLSSLPFGLDMLPDASLLFPITPAPFERHLPARTESSNNTPNHVLSSHYHQREREPNLTPPNQRRQPSRADGPLVSSPNLDTGLVRVFLSGYFGHKWDFGLNRDQHLVGLHELKNAGEHAAAWARVQRELVKYGKGEWKVPRALRDLK